MTTFVVPGALDQVTGGYLFDRRIVEGARARGREMYVVELPGRHPNADATACEAAAQSLATLPDDAVVVIDGLALPAYAACLTAHASRLSVVGFVHHPLALETGLSSIEAARYGALEARLWPMLRGVLCPSRSTADAVVAAGVAAACVAVVPPGTERPHALPERSVTGHVRLLCVGTVCARKGHDLLIDALTGLRDLPWRLDCIGSLERSDAFVASLRASIAAAGLDHRVALRGEVPPERIAQAYAAADVFVLPSYHEGYGMAFAEALAHGLPVVGTTAGAIPATVPTQAGLLVEPGNAAALREALRRVMTEAPLRTRLAAGAAAAGACLPDWHDAVDAWLAALDRLAA